MEYDDDDEIFERLFASSTINSLKLLLICCLLDVPLPTCTAG
jgi:hypothetical protein